MPIAHDELDTVEVQHWGSHRCVDCGRCDRAGGKLTMASCVLRSCDIANPSDTVCADHSALIEKVGRHPVGPVYAISGDTLEVLAESPDSLGARNYLLDIVESCEDLTVRDRVAIWQLRELGDRRVHVPVSRIEDAHLLGHGGSRSAGALEGSIARSLAGRDFEPEQGAGSFIERLSIPARLLLLTSLIFGGIVFWLAFEIQAESGVGSVVVSTLPSAVAVGLYLRIGVAVLKRMGVPVRAAPPRDVG